MKKKGDAHETLSLFFNRDGVPPNMVMDVSKYQTLGYFSNKCQEAYCHMNDTDPYSPCKLQAEGTIGEMKKGSGSNMVLSDAPKQIWNYAL